MANDGTAAVAVGPLKTRIDSGFDENGAPIAAVLVGEAKAQVDAARYNEKLTRFVANGRRALADNPRTRPAMTAPPTISVSTSAPGGAFTAGYPSAPSSAASYLPFITYSGGYAIYLASQPQLRVRASTLNNTTYDPITGAGTDCKASRQSFWSDGPVVYVALIALSTTRPIRFIVDGHYIATPAFVTTGNTRTWVCLDFSAVGGRANREITVEGDGAWGIYQILVTPVDTVRATKGSKFRICTNGDSYGAGPDVGHYLTPAPVLADGFCFQLGDYLDADVAAAGQGGTGFTVANGAVPALKDRLQDFDWNYDLFFTSTLLNDVVSSKTPAEIVAGASIVADAQRAANPYAPIIFNGAFCPPKYSGAAEAGAGNFLTAMATAENAVAAALAARNDPRLLFIRNQTAPKPQIYGTGGSAASGQPYDPNGSGNSDIMSGIDGVHKSLAGHNYEARLQAENILDFCERILAQ